MLTTRLVKKLRDFTLDVELTVKAGEVMVLIGENGAGKSTILNLLAGLMDPDEGEILLNNAILFGKKGAISVPPEERGIGYVFQNYALFPHLSIFENVAFGLRMRNLSAPEIRRKIELTLLDLGILGLAGEKPGSLSGGQQQRVALARVMITSPRMLLLDEPLSALDKRARDKIRDELRETLKRMNLPTILVTHSIRDARVLGDTVIALSRGEIIGSGVPDELAHTRSNDWFSSLND